MLELSPADVLAEERTLGLSGAFSAQDAMTTGVVWASLAGEKVAEFTKTKPTGPLRLLPLSDEDRAILVDRFLLSNQQGRGAWFIPDQVNLQIGQANLPHYFRRYPRFSSGIAHEEKGKFALADSPDSLCFWAVLGPLFEVLYRPITLRTTDDLGGGRDDHIKEWKAVDDWYRGLGIEVEGELEVFRYGGGWSKLRSAERLAAKEALLLALDRSVTAEVAARYRVLATRPLIEKYFARAKRGAPTMRQVLTKQLQTVLCAFYGGDWLAFLKYIGEEPHPEERIATSLPETKLYVSAASRVPAVAAQHGIDPAEVERMLAAFWPGERTASPVEKRVSALKRFWETFDEIHSRQAPGMTPLWGFVDEGYGPRLTGADNETSGPAWFVPGTHLKLLPAALLQDIESLWDGTFLPTHPERLASTPNPYGLMCRALGPALKFWHGAALTAWFVSEGPYSRTDMAGLAKHHRRELSDLEELGCPVDQRLFEDLVAAEGKLGKPTPIVERESQSRVASGLMTLTVSTTVGTKRAGFGKLRDTITRHRRAWTERHLGLYLHRRWEGEILKAAREYNKLYEQKGKAPSLKQFAPFAEDATNHWFGGDVSALFAAFGEKSPVETCRQRLLPRDIDGFMWRVFQLLGGKRTNWSDLAKTIVGNDRAKQDAEWHAHGDRKRLAELSVRYVQIREAIGGPPGLRDIGTSKFKPIATPLGDEVEEAWRAYSAAIEAALNYSS